MTSIWTSSKVAQVLRDIEAARCRGKWHLIPDLAKRFKKYCPSGTVLEQTILIEAALSRLTDRAEQEQQQNDEDDDDAASPQRITVDTSKPFLHQLHAVLALPETDDDAPVQREFAKIILARCHFECGQYKDTVDIVEQLAFSKTDVSSGYNAVLFLQARAMKALSYEQLGDITAATQSYRGIVSLLDETFGESLDQKVLVEWAEEALRRAIIMLISRAQAVDDVKAMLEFIRGYQKVTYNVSSSWRPHKRLYALRLSIKYLSDLYKNGRYPSGTDASMARYQVAAEIMQLNAMYERLLFSILPRSGEKNKMLFEFLEQMADDLSYIGDTDPRHLLGLKQVLLRAAEHTFNSPTVSRLLFHTLVQIGDYEEAAYALRSYLYLVGLGSQTWDEAREKGDAMVHAKGKLCTYPHITGSALERLVDTSSSKKSIASQRTDECESTEDILNVLLGAVKMYCLHIKQASKAVEYAEMARLKMDKVDPQSPLRRKVYLAAGSAYIYIAYQSRNSHLRSTYFQKALDYLNEALAADPSDWETYYMQALFHATTRDIQSVIPLISKAIQLNPSYIPSWNLLSLACSCPTQDDNEHALQACDIGLREALEIDANPGQQLSLHITRVLLLEKMKGPQAALEAQEALFAMYSKVITTDISLPDPSVYNDEMVLSGAFNNLDDNSITTAATAIPRRGSETSMYLKVDELQISASKSHDDIRGKAKNGRGTTTTATKTTTTRSRSASSFSSRHLGSNGHSAGFLTVPSSSEEAASVKTSSTQNSRHHHHHHFPFHLHSSRSTGRRSNGESLPKSMLKVGSNKVSQAPSIHDSIQTDIDDSVSVLSSSMNSFYTVQQSNVPSSKIPLGIRLKQQESKHLLVDLWLLSANTFLKLDKHEEALKAVQEAENIDSSSNPRVYCMLGRILLAQKQLDDAIEAFEKAFKIDASDVESCIWLARTLMQSDSKDSAEGLLEQATKEFAWDSAEAWLLLGEIYQSSGRLDRAKDCMMYALNLVETTPIQPFSVLPCFV